MKTNLRMAMAGCMALAALASCTKAETSTETADELPRVELDVAHSVNVPQTKTYTATIEADNLNNIAPNQPNRITSIKADVGDHVKRGQVLVTFDETGINQARINMEQAQRELNRAKTLLEIGAGTQQAVDQLTDQYNIARQSYDLLSRNSTLVSPITGVVTARNYDPGDMTGSLPVLVVGQLSPQAKVMINVSENDRSLIRQGMPVDVTFDAYPGETFPARVSRVYPVVDPGTRTFSVEVMIPNPGERFVQGMFARVDINLGEKNNVVVPDRAVVKQTGSGNRYVYVYKDGRVSFNKVELGRRIDNAYELLSGVEDGDSVVIVGQTQLADGVPVEVINR